MWIAVDSAARLLKPLYPAAQDAETEVAVGLERVQAKRLSQDEGLPVVGYSGLDCWGSVVCMNLAEEPQGSHLMSPFLVRLGKRQRTLGERLCFLQVASQQMRLPQGVAERLSDSARVWEGMLPAGHFLLNLHRVSC
jgi:hypothetical protein